MELKREERNGLSPTIMTQPPGTMEGLGLKVICSAARPPGPVWLTCMPSGVEEIIWNTFFLKADK